MSWKHNKKLADTVAEMTGERFCRACNKSRKVEGGKWRIGGMGQRIWRCKSCVEKTSPSGFK